MQAAQEQLEKKNQELADMNREKSKKLAQMTNLYNMLKARAMRSEMLTAASDTVSQTLNSLSSRNGTIVPTVQPGPSPGAQARPRFSKARTPKTPSYPMSPEGIERLHRYQRSGTGSSRRAGAKNDPGTMAPPLGRPVWNAKSRK
jgi:E3 ubiquitin-protein ligase CCNP1IP1